MKYCTRCGKELFDEAVVCTGCGCSCQPQTDINNPGEEDKKSFGWALLGFMVPLAGLILYLVWKDKTPLKAKSCGKGALIGFISSTIFSIAISALSTFLVMSGSSYLLEDSYSYITYDDMYI